MCTTMMVLTTIALILRQRFSNKIKPSRQDSHHEKKKWATKTLRPVLIMASSAVSSRCSHYWDRKSQLSECRVNVKMKPVINAECTTFPTL
uniref:Secreted protein n=1 Tax=Acanthochromis polyacanthus TaxID=80966 RepID=A0A3Q1GFI7_9TELE